MEPLMTNRELQAAIENTRKHCFLASVDFSIAPDLYNTMFYHLEYLQRIQRERAGVVIEERPEGE